MARISLRLSEGEADLGGTTIPLQRDPQGALQLGGGDGPKLRALRFGERGRIVRQALTGRDGVAEVVSGVTSAAVIDPGKAAVDPKAVSVLALHLAGAGSGGPGFSETIALLARSLGWSPDQLADTEASEVDELASQLSDALLAARAESSQWQSIVFRGGGASGRQAAPLGDLQRELARDLLERGQSLPDLAALGAPAAAREGHEPRAAQNARSEQTDEAPQDLSLGRSSGEDSTHSKAQPGKSSDVERQADATLGTAAAKPGKAAATESPGKSQTAPPNEKHPGSPDGGEEQSSEPSHGSSEQRAATPPAPLGRGSNNEEQAASAQDLAQPTPEKHLDRFVSQKRGGERAADGDLLPLQIRREAGSDMEELLHGFDDAHRARQHGSGPAAGATSASKAPGTPPPDDWASKAGPALEADDLEELADFIANELHRAADQRRVDP